MLNRIMSIITILVLSIPTWSFQGTQNSAFYVDFASFASDSTDLVKLEVYYQIYTSKLLHIRKNGKYVANYSVNAVIKKGRKQITASETEGFLYKETFEKASNPEDFLINSFKFFLKPGKYKIEITLNDSNAGTSLPLKTNLVLPDYKSKIPMFSSIEFAREISEAGEPNVFDKSPWKVIPSCSRIYGDSNNELKYYYEYYSDKQVGDTTYFIFEVLDNKNNYVVSDTVCSKITKLNGFVGKLSLEKLKPGYYNLVIKDQSSKKGKTVSTSGNFKIALSGLAMVEYDIDIAIDQLRYIANSKEMDKLRNAGKDKIIQLWNEFWKSRDPSPGTQENELRDEYYRRIAYSNKYYSLPGKDGWKTDMGRIHIIYGEPDDIERHPFDIDVRPYEIWYYYKPRQRFLFIDEKGYGEYTLQYPYDGDISKQIDFRKGKP